MKGAVTSKRVVGQSANPISGRAKYNKGSRQVAYFFAVFFAGFLAAGFFAAGF